MTHNPDLMLLSLLAAYVEGDRAARPALADWLEERDDPRAEQVRRAAVNWDEVAEALFLGRHHYLDEARRRHGRRREPWQRAEVNRCRWWIECALAGSPVPDDVAGAVRQAHRRWLEGLFPELKRGPS
jgi:uncharacterized protein (TIGR02996 family)